MVTTMSSTIRYVYGLFFLLVKTYLSCVLSIATDECGSSVGPGARKPSVGEGIQSRRLLVLTLFSFLHLFLVCVLIMKCKTLGTNNYKHYWSSSTIRYTCAYKFIRTREITSVVYGRNAENEPVSRIKNDHKYRNAIEKRHNSGATRILSPLV